MLTVDQIKLPKAGQETEVYIKFLQSLQATVGFFDRSKGHISWIQGQALLRARKVCKKPGDWSAFLKAIHMEPTTAKHLRRIGHEFSEAQTMELGYTEMLRRIYPGYRDNLKDDLAKDKDEAETKPKRQKSTAPSFTAMVHELTKSKKDIQSVKSRLGNKRPHVFELQSASDARRVLQIIVNEASPMLKTVTVWQNELTRAA